MKLWELRRVSELPVLASNEAPKLIGVIVRAESDAEARELASRESYDKHDWRIWLDNELTCCAALDETPAAGRPAVVLAQWIGSTQKVDKEHT